MVAPVSSLPNSTTVNDKRIWQTAQKLEASFLAEMLKSAGVESLGGDFGGGPGEEQFSSFLRQAQAKSMVNAGGLGLAQHFYKSMKEHADEG